MVGKATIDPKTDGFWVQPCGKEVDRMPPPSWKQLQEILGDSARRFRVMAFEVHYLMRKWISEKYGPQISRKYEDLYKESLLDWLPTPARTKDPLPTIGEVYRDTYTDLQKFCVFLEQCIIDHKNAPEDIGSFAWFQSIADSLQQLLCYLATVMSALKVTLNPPVKRDIMKDQDRNPARPPDQIIIRDFIGMQQLWNYLSMKQDFFSNLRDHRSKAPATLEKD